MEIGYSILLFLSSSLLIIGIVIGWHEFGHFVAARLVGVKVKRFAIGFGKPIITIVSKAKIKYVIGIIPLGGYVKLLDDREEDVPPHLLHQSFNQQKCWKKLVIVLAGPLFNFLFAIFGFWVVFSIGFSTLKPVIKSVEQTSIAARADIQAGDHILAIDNHMTRNWADILQRLIMLYGDEGYVEIKLQRGSEVVVKNIELSGWKLNSLHPDALKSLGIEPFLPKERNSPLRFEVKENMSRAWIVSVQKVWDYTLFNAVVLYKIVTGKISIESLAGPLSIFRIGFKSFQSGIVSFMALLGFLSIAIGFANLLPIPGLDGAQVVYSLIEKITGKKISIALQVLLFRLGIICLALLFLQVLMSDIKRFFY